jgi:hypothetical protein
MMTGKPYSFTKAWASVGSETGPGVPGTTGTLFFIAEVKIASEVRDKYQLSELLSYLQESR